MLIESSLVKTICRVPHRHLISSQPPLRPPCPFEQLIDFHDSSTERIWIQGSQYSSVSIPRRALVISTTTDKLCIWCLRRLELLCVFLSTCTETTTSSVRYGTRVQRTHSSPCLPSSVRLLLQGTKRTGILVNLGHLSLLKVLGYGQHQSFAQSHVGKTRSYTSYTNSAFHNHAFSKLTSKEGQTDKRCPCLSAWSCPWRVPVPSGRVSR